METMIGIGVLLAGIGVFWVCFALGVYSFTRTGREGMRTPANGGGAATAAAVARRKRRRVAHSRIGRADIVSVAGAHRHRVTRIMARTNCR
jgi:hypothetical protein